MWTVVAGLGSGSGSGPGPGSGTASGRSPALRKRWLKQRSRAAAKLSALHRPLLRAAAGGGGGIAAAAIARVGEREGEGPAGRGLGRLERGRAGGWPGVLFC